MDCSSQQIAYLPRNIPYNQILMGINEAIYEIKIRGCGGGTGFQTLP
jgi:hypothetical protein